MPVTLARGYEAVNSCLGPRIRNFIFPAGIKQQGIAGCENINVVIGNADLEPAGV